MQIEFTTKAKEYIATNKGEGKDCLSLLYQPIGCICSNDAVFYLENSAKYPKDAIFVDSNLGKIAIEKDKVQYLDEENKIDFNEREHHLELKGKMMGYITPNLRWVEK